MTLVATSTIPCDVVQLPIQPMIETFGIEDRKLLSDYIWITYLSNSEEFDTFKRYGKLVQVDLRDITAPKATLIDDLARFLELGSKAYYREVFAEVQLNDLVKMICAPALPIEHLSETQRANPKHFRTFTDALTQDDD